MVYSTRQYKLTSGLDRLAVITRTCHTEHSRRLRGSGKIIAIHVNEVWPVPKRNSDCCRSQKLHFTQFSEYSATFMSCNEGTLFKLIVFSRAY